jgi:nicotinamide-nucleotide amidase
MSPSDRPCEIIAIGNELLIGDVQDTNTYWLIQQLTGLGGLVRRCVIVRDELVAIAAALQSSVAAGTALVITTSGLGPTSDDLTLAAVASAFSLPLVVHTGALDMLTRRYAELAAAGRVLSGAMLESRRKMAVFPQGAEPIFNPVGGAPAALLRVGATAIVCLPGVPQEMKSIFTHSLGPLLVDLLGGAAYQFRTCLLNAYDESSIAAPLHSVVERNPLVYIKSRAVRLDGQIRIRLSFSATGPDAPAVSALLDSAVADLQHTMSALGLTCTESPA